MDKEQQRKYDERRLETLKKEYNDINETVKAIRDDINDLTFEERVPDARERQLMTGRRYALESLQENIRETIVFLRKRIQANRPEPWEEDNAIRTVETPCGPVRVVNTDKASKEELVGMIHHCGQDAGECKVSCGTLEATVSCKNLLGMQVVSVGGSKTRCVGCPQENDSCFKVELIGGNYLCLARPQQNERPVISFDEVEQQQDETTRPIMDGIREQAHAHAHAFIDYLDSVVKG